MILARGKEAICDYLLRDVSLERYREKAGKFDALERLRSATPPVPVHFIYQPEMRGLGDVMMKARHFIGHDEVFMVLLGDTVMHGGAPLPEMVAVWNRYHVGAEALEP